MKPLNCIILSILKIEAVCLHTLVELSQQSSLWGQIILESNLYSYPTAFLQLFSYWMLHKYLVKMQKMLKNLQSLLQFLSHISWLILQKKNSPLVSLIYSTLFCFILPKTTALINNSIRHFLLNHQGCINFFTECNFIKVI